PHRALAAGEAGVELERRAGRRHAGHSRDARIERLGKAAAPAAHLEVGVAGELAHRGGQVLHRGAIYEINPIAQRHAERYADYRKECPSLRPSPAERAE